MRVRLREAVMWLMGDGFLMFECFCCIMVGGVAIYWNELI